jgi:hypothetical protein
MVLAKIYFNEKAEYLIEDPDNLEIHFEYLEMENRSTDSKKNLEEINDLSRENSVFFSPIHSIK